MVFLIPHGRHTLVSGIEAVLLKAIKGAKSMYGYLPFRLGDGRYVE